MTFEMEDINRMLELLSTRYPAFNSLAQEEETKNNNENGDEDEDHANSSVCGFGANCV